MLTLLTTFFWRKPRALTVALIAAPLAWLVVVYLGSLAALLLQSFYSLDDFTGSVIREFTLTTYKNLFDQANVFIILRTLTMAGLVTIASAIVAYPIAYYAAYYASGKWKIAFYLGIMLPLWSSYLVKIYAWKMILAKEGILTWFLSKLGLLWALEGVLSLPIIGGSSLSFSYIGTFIVFLYLWLPFMILPLQTALERVPKDFLEAAADLGANKRKAFWDVTFPLALPGLIAGSIFTFSLTLGDYIVPQIVGNSRPILGQAVYTLQGVAGDIPLAAAFTIVPIIIMGIYLTIAKRMGAFNAL